LQPSIDFIGGIVLRMFAAWFRVIFGMPLHAVLLEGVERGGAWLIDAGSMQHFQTLLIYMT